MEGNCNIFEVCKNKGERTYCKSWQLVVIKWRARSLANPFGPFPHVWLLLLLFSQDSIMWMTARQLIYLIMFVPQIQSKRYRAGWCSIFWTTATKSTDIQQIGASGISSDKTDQCWISVLQGWKILQTWGTLEFIRRFWTQLRRIFQQQKLSLLRVIDSLLCEENWWHDRVKSNTVYKIQSFGKKNGWKSWNILGERIQEMPKSPFLRISLRSNVHYVLTSNKWVC